MSIQWRIGDKVRVKKDCAVVMSEYRGAYGTVVGCHQFMDDVYIIKFRDETTQKVFYDSIVPDGPFTEVIYGD